MLDDLGFGWHLYPPPEGPEAYIYEAGQPVFVLLK